MQYLCIYLKKKKTWKVKSLKNAQRSYDFKYDIANLFKAPGKSFTPPLDATAGTHSCLNRMLMKEKHRKARGFGSPQCTHACTHELTHKNTCKEIVGSLFLSSIVLECITAVLSRLYVNQARRSPAEFFYASGSSNTIKTELTNSGNSTA